MMMRRDITFVKSKLETRNPKNTRIRQMCPDFRVLNFSLDYFEIRDSDFEFSASDAADIRAPDMFVPLSLHANREFIRQNPFSKRFER